MIGQALSGSPGTWAGTPVIAFGYQWQRCDAAGAACASVAGANGARYVLGAADVGHAMRLRVRASNDAASVWRTTTATRPVAGG